MWNSFKIWTFWFPNSFQGIDLSMRTHLRILWIQGRQGRNRISHQRQQQERSDRIARFLQFQGQSIILMEMARWRKRWLIWIWSLNEFTNKLLIIRLLYSLIPVPEFHLIITISFLVNPTRTPCLFALINLIIFGLKIRCYLKMCYILQEFYLSFLNLFTGSIMLLC